MTRDKKVKIGIVCIEIIFIIILSFILYRGGRPLTIKDGTTALLITSIFFLVDWRYISFFRSLLVDRVDVDSTTLVYMKKKARNRLITGLAILCIAIAIALMFPDQVRG